jgi:DNA polymerase-3 subunit epsilon
MPGKDLVWFDTETTGLNAESNGIIEIACVRTSPDASEIIDEYQTKIVIEPERYIVDDEALRINGYTKEKWASACSLEQAMIDVVDRMPFGVQLAGHNVPFDLAFLKFSLKRCGLKVPNFYYHTVDTMSLGHPLVVKGHIPNVKLVTLSNFFGVEHIDAHTAMADVKACIGVYRKILAYYPNLS